MRHESNAVPRNIALNRAYASVARAVEMGNFNAWGLSEGATNPEHLGAESITSSEIDEQIRFMAKEIVTALGTNILLKKLGVPGVPFKARLTNPHAALRIKAPAADTPVGIDDFRMEEELGISKDAVALEADVVGIVVASYKEFGNEPVGTLRIFEADHPDSMPARYLSHLAGKDVLIPTELVVSKGQLFIFGLGVIDPCFIDAEGHRDQKEGAYFIEHGWDQDLIPATD